MTATETSTTANWPLFRAMVGIGTVCALLIVGAFILTAPVIEKNQAALLDQAIVALFPQAASRIPYQLMADGRFLPSAAEQKTTPALPALYAVFDDSHRLLGFAIKAQGMGYQDTIQLLYGYSPDRQAIIGIKILASRETPGLGDRIGKDPSFLSNFAQLAVTLTADNSRLLHSIESVKAGSVKQPWQIDTISGATISSRAVANILDASAEHWISPLTRHLEQFHLENENNPD